MRTTQMLSVENLQIGMYVAQLDRPWLETPFLFQGFYIRDQDEIDELRRYCEHVYVSTETHLPINMDLAAPAASFWPGSEPVPNGATTYGGSSIASEASSLGDTFAKRQLRLKGQKFGNRQNLYRRWGSRTTMFWREVRERVSRVVSFRRRGGMADDSEAPDFDFETPEHIYEESTSITDELQTATKVHSDALIVIKEVMDSVNGTDSLDVAHLKTAVTPMVESMLRNPAALACLVRIQSKDDYLYHHSLSCSVWATILGRQIGLNLGDLEVVALGGMLLDVGMTLIPDEILNSTDPLSNEETSLVRDHVEEGLDLLTHGGQPDRRVIDMIAYHHERYNGTGYPNALRGNDIPVFGRIAGIVDTYDAMISDRPYSKAMSSYNALRCLQKIADVEFQAEIVEQFTQAIGAFPTGTLVELNTGEVAIVTKQNRIRRLRPEVMLIMDAKRNILQEFELVDLSERTVSEGGRHSLWIEHGLPPGAYGIEPSKFYLD
ncbi:MAG: HD-GYP domain-containing protein [Pseudomonadota bacterium]